MLMGSLQSCWMPRTATQKYSKSNIQLSFFSSIQNHIIKDTFTRNLLWSPSSPLTLYFNTYFSACVTYYCWMYYLLYVVQWPETTSISFESTANWDPPRTHQTLWAFLLKFTSNFVKGSPVLHPSHIPQPQRVSYLGLTQQRNMNIQNGYRECDEALKRTVDYISGTRIERPKLPRWDKSENN